VTRVLVLEDEQHLRRNMVRALEKLDGLEVVDAETVDEATTLIDERAPSLVLSDLDLPGRSGVEVITELERRGLSVPVVFISAYVQSFRSRIPTGPNIDVVSKPVSLEELRRIVLDRLDRARSAAPGHAPFGIPEYLQLAALGSHSLELEVSRGEAVVGRIAISNGVVWSASDERGAGVGAFLRLVHSDGRVQCSALRERPPEPDIGRSVESLLLEAVTLEDEKRHHERVGDASEAHSAIAEGTAILAEQLRGAESSSTGTVSWLFGQRDPERGGEHLQEHPIDNPAPRPRDEPAPRADATAPAPSLATSDAEDGALGSDSDESTVRSFERAREDGLDALLARDYRAALEAFQRAEALKPGDPMVTTNLTRLAQLEVDKNSE
jgi:DNA-binding response OmpR family regulator